MVKTSTIPVAWNNSFLICLSASIPPHCVFWKEKKKKKSVILLKPKLDLVTDLLKISKALTQLKENWELLRCVARP